MAKWKHDNIVLRLILDNKEAPEPRINREAGTLQEVPIDT